MKQRKEKKEVPSRNYNLLSFLYGLIKYSINHPIHALTYLLLFNQVVRTVADTHKDELSFGVADQHVQPKMDEAIQLPDYKEVDRIVDPYKELRPNKVLLMEEKLTASIYNTYFTSAAEEAEFTRIADELLTIDPSNEIGLSAKFSEAYRYANEEQKRIYSARLRNIEPTTSIGYFSRGAARVYMGGNSLDFSIMAEGKRDIEKASQMEEASGLKKFYEDNLNLLHSEVAYYFKKLGETKLPRPHVVEEDKTWISNTSYYFFIMAVLAGFGASLTKLLYHYSLKKNNQKIKKFNFKTYKSILTATLNKYHKFFLDTAIWNPNGNTVSVENLRFLSTIDIASTPYHHKFPSVESITVDVTELKKMWADNLKKIFKRKIVITDQYASIKVDEPNIFVDPRPALFHLDRTLEEMNKRLFETIIMSSPEVRFIKVKEKIKSTEDSFIKIFHDHLAFYRGCQKDLSENKTFTLASQENYPANKLIQNKSNECLTIIHNIENFVEYFNNQNNNNNHSQHNANDNLTKTIASFESKLQGLKIRFQIYENKEWESHQPFKTMEEFEKVVSILESIRIDIFKTLASYRNKFSSLPGLITDIQIAIKKLNEIPIDQTSKNISRIKKTTKPQSNKKKLKESKEEKEIRLAQVKALKKQKKEETALKRKQEEESRRHKEEVEEKVKSSTLLAEKIAKVSNDPRFYILEHNLEIIAQAAQFFKNPEHFDLVKFCSGDSRLQKKLSTEGYKIIVYYTLLHCLMRSAHSLGQMMMTYQQFNLIEMQPYRVRNALMHGSWALGVMKTKLLCDAADEINGLIRNLIPTIRLHGFSSLPKIIKIENLLFSETELAKLEAMKDIDSKFCLSQLKVCLDHLVIMGKIVHHIHEKDPSNYTDHCGIIHHAIRGCVCVIGELLNKLKEKDFHLYKRVINIILYTHDTFKVKDRDSDITLFQDIRIKVGHFFSEESSKPTYNAKPEQDIFQELHANTIYRLAVNSEDLCKKLTPVICECLVETAFFSSNRNGNSNSCESVTQTKFAL